MILLLAYLSLETSAGIVNSVDRLREVWRMKELAAHLDRNSSTKFWTDAVNFSPDKCTADFDIELRGNLDRNDGLEYGDKIELREFIVEQTITNCCKKFADRVDKWNRLLASIVDLHRFAKLYRVDQHDEADVIWRVADLVARVGGKVKDPSQEDFESMYRSDSPCSELYGRIRQDDELLDYLHFLRLARLPGYLERVTQPHEYNVHLMALCDHIDNKPGFMDLAYYVYLK